MIVRYTASTTQSARTLTVTGSASQTSFAAISGSVSGTDSDLNTTLVYGIQGGAATAKSGEVAKTGSFGTLTLNTATGAYSFAPSASAINPLQASVSESYTLTVSDGVSTASGVLTVQIDVPPPTQLAITTQPSGVVSGAVMIPSPVVEIRDSQGNRTASTGTVTVSIDSGTGGVLSGSQTVNAVNGIATFNGLTMTGTLGSTYRLRFSSRYKASSTAGQVEWAYVVRNARGAGRSLLAIDQRQFTGSGIQPNQVETIQLLDLYNGAAVFLGADAYWAQFEIQSALADVATHPQSRLMFAGGEEYALRADFTVAPLYSPTFSAAFTAQQPPTLAAVGVSGTEDTPLSLSLAQFSPGFSDPEGASLADIQIVSLPATGTLTLAGSAVVVAQVIPAAQLGTLIYTPAANETGDQTFTVKASDGTAWSGVATVTMTLAPVNDAPVAGTAAFTSIAEDVALADNAGTAVAVFADAGSDGDAGALKGIAITSVDSSNGSWQYTVDGGGVWSSLSGVSMASARLLKGDELHRVRFLPNPHYHGTATIQYRAWDQVVGSDGTLLDLTATGGGAWALVAYGADASLGGFLNSASGTFSSAVRSGSAVLPALSLLKSSSELAMSWTVAGGGFPVGGIASYSHAIAFPVPQASAMSFDGTATGPPDFHISRNAAISFAVGSSHPDQSLVTVRTLIGSPGMPAQMYLRNKSFGAGYGGVYGLVMNDGNNPALDYGQIPDSQQFKAVYLDHGTGSDQRQGLVMGGAGGAQNSYVPSTMALWVGLTEAQIQGLAGGPVTVSGNRSLAGIGTTYLDVVPGSLYASFSANSATGTLTVTPVNDAPVLTVSSSSSMVLNASTLKASTGATADGVYSLFFNGVSTPVYCLMNDAVAGGGWMLAMKGANSGATFNYSSAHWTTATTLNTAANRRNDVYNEDAKFEVFNTMPATEILVIFPEATAGGAITGQSYGFIWRESMPTPANTAAYSGRPAQGDYTGKTLRELFAGGEKIFIRDAVSTTPYRAAGSGVFSTQTDVRFFGFNYVSTVNNNRARFGFGWNENGGGVYPGGNEGSNDVTGGLGLDRVNWSAGDYIGCCQNSVGMNRPLKFEVYVRGPVSASMLTEDVAGNILFSSPLVQDVDSASLTVTLSVPDGVITGNPGSGVTVGGSSIARTFVGAAADLNAYFSTAGSVTYLGAPNNSADRTMTVTVSDGGATATGSRVLSFIPVNDAPVLGPVAKPGTEDTVVTFAATDFHAVYSDVEGAALSSITVVTPPASGSLSLSGVAVTVGQTIPAANLGNLTYTPVANDTGSKTFTVKASDGVALSEAAVVTISLAAVNDAPLAAAQSVTTAEEVAQAIVLNGTDVEGSSLTHTVVSPPTKGVLSGTAPNLTYTPNANVNGSDAFTFKVNDGTADSAAATVSILITPVNDAPVVVGASGVASQPLKPDTARIVSLAGSTTIRGIASDGDRIFINHAGLEIRTFGFDGSLVASRSVQNLPSGSHQMVFARGAIFVRNGSALYRISTHDWTSSLVSVDASRPLLTAAGWLSGSLLNFPDGRLGVMGPTSGGQFLIRLYTVSADGLSLIWDRDLPINDSWAVDEHGTASDGQYLVRISFTQGYKTYDLNSGTVAYDGQAWNLRVVTAGGAISNPTFIAYDPKAGRYLVGDYDASQVLVSESQSTSVVSDPVDEDAEPIGATVASLFGAVFQDATDAVTGGSSANPLLGVAVMGNSATSSMGQWQYQTAGQSEWVSIPDSVSPSAARVVRAEDRLRFRPGSDFNGSASPLTVALMESGANPASGSTLDASLRGGTTSLSLKLVSVTQLVNPVNDAPLNTVPGTQVVTEDARLSLAGASTVSVGDVDSAALSVELSVLQGTVTVTLPVAGVTVSGGANGSATLKLAGSATALNQALATLGYQGSLDYFGADTLTVRTTDSGGLVDVDTVAITVTPINDPPLALAQTVVTPEDTSVLVSVSGTDVDSTELTFELVEPPAHGSVTLEGGVALYTPAPDYFGSDQFTFRVLDGVAASAPGVVTVEITPVNDPPVIGAVESAIIRLVGVDWNLPADLPRRVALPISDIDSAVDGSLAVSVSSGDSAVVPASAIRAVHQGGWFLEVAAVVPDADGTATVPVTVTVTDAAGGSTSRAVDVVVQAPPRIVSPLVGGEFPTGGTLLLTIEATGTAPFTYVWYHNSVRVEGADGPMLNVSPAGSERSGRYSVAVSNDLGEHESGLATVVMVDPPKFLTPPVNVWALEGSPAELKADAIGGEPLIYEWFREGQRVYTGKTWNRSSIVASEAGTYELRVRNSVATLRSGPVFVTVQRPRVDVRGWGDNSFRQLAFDASWTNLVSVAAGERFTVGLRADGSVVVTGALSQPPVFGARVVDVAAGGEHAVALLENGTIRVWGSTTPAVTGAEARSGGVFQVVAGADYTAWLDRDGRLQIAGGAASGITVPSESSLRYRSLAAGPTALLGRLRSTGVWSSVGGKGRAVPVVQGVLAGLSQVAVGLAHGLGVSGGGANVVAWGDGGFEQISVPLESLPSAMTAVSAGHYHSVVLGSANQVVAWGAGSSAAATAWPHFGQSVVPADLKAAQVAAGGFHTVVLAHRAPEFSIALAAQSVQLGQAASLTVVVEGVAPITYQWTRNGTTLANQTGATLTMASTTVADGGTYRVTATTPYGSIFSEATLTVIEPPTVTTTATTQTLNAGANATLSVSPSGTGPFTYQWLLNDEPIEGATSQNYALSGVGAAQAGVYKVRVSGAGGTVTSTVTTVSVLSLPVFTVQPLSVVAISGQTASLKATATGGGTVTLQWQKQSGSGREAPWTAIAGATSGSLDFSNVQSSDAGTYRVVASNAAGSVNSAEVTLTVVDPAGPGTPDITVATVLSGTATSVSLPVVTAGVARELSGVVGTVYRLSAQYTGTEPVQLHGCGMVWTWWERFPRCWNCRRWMLVGSWTACIRFA